jgi:hypothetical protein
MAAPLEGYASVVSAAPGEAIDFHLRSDAAHGDVALNIYRRGIADTLVRTAQGTAFVAGPQDDATLAVQGCGWPADPQLRTIVPPQWSSGYYVAIATANGASCTMPFLVRAAAPNASGILLKVSDTTAQAYNAWGGPSFYSTPPAAVISFDRPSDVGLYEVYQRPFFAWAEARGVSFDVCSSLDLHFNPRLLAPYRLFVSLGHDEYWSLEMRDQVEAFIAAGGNAAFFSANTCYWQIRVNFTNGQRQIVCYKEGEAGHSPDPQRDDPSRITCAWYDSPVLRPENSMTAVSYRNGAGWWVDPVVPERRYRGYTVVTPEHPLLRGTGLSAGDEFGRGTSLDDAILGYETDAALLDGTHPTGTDGTPLAFVPLATADLRDWEPNGKGGFATAGVYRRNGAVFTAATVNWAGGLAGSAPVERITQNVLADFAQAANAIGVRNADFEAWAGAAPAEWIPDGAGSFAASDVDDATLANQFRFSPGGSHALEIDAQSGDTWIGQPGLAFDPGRSYAAGCWAKTDTAGVTIRLQTTDSWTDFATAEHSGSGKWEYLFAAGTIPAQQQTPCRIKLQVAAGAVAQFARVSALALDP